LKAVVFGSGRGSNFQAIYQEIENDKLNLEIAAVFSNNESSGILEFAKKKNIITETISEKNYNSYEDYEESLLGLISTYGANIIILAGYIRKIPDSLIASFPNKIINIHPSLLPAFGGKGMYGERVHQAVYKAGCKITGATVHFVNQNYDEGQIIIQNFVRLTGKESAEEIAEKVLEIEHKLYIKAIKIIINEEYRWEDKRFILEDLND
jgi:phosphoribosylglycinamide formyltransferase 1